MVIGTDTYRSTTYDFLLTFRNHGPISHHFRDRRWFQSKIAKFSLPPHVFCAPTDGVPLELGYWHRGQKNQNDGATRRSKQTCYISKDCAVQSVVLIKRECW